MNSNMINDDAKEEAVSLGMGVQTVGWLSLLIVPWTIYYSTDWTALNVSTPVSYCILLLLCAVLMWVFRLVPDFVPSIFLLIGCLFLGVAPPNVIFSGYGSTTFFLALSVLSLSGVIMRSGLSKRIILYAMHKGRPNNKFLFSTIVFFFGIVSTPFIPSTNARSSMIAPFLDDALKHIPQNSKEHQRLIISLLSGISLLSPMFLSAKSINLLFWGMLSVQDQNVFNYIFWIIAAAVPGVIMVILFLIVQGLLFWNNEHIVINREFIEQQYRSLPKLSKQEIIGFVALIAFVVLILTYSYHRIDIYLVAFMVFFALLFFNVLDKQQISSSIDWSFLIFLGAMIGFTQVIQFLNLGDFITSGLSWLMQYLKTNIFLFIIYLSSVVFLFRLFMPINATVILLAGALIPATAIYGNYAWIIGFIILMMSESYILPYQASYYMQCESILGKRHAQALRSHRVYAVNGLTFLIKLIAILLSVPYWDLLGIL